MKSAKEDSDIKGPTGGSTNLPRNPAFLSHKLTLAPQTF